jgi:deoxyribodipyrimidine photo-lyase
MGTPYAVFTPYKNAWLKNRCVLPAALSGGKYHARRWRRAPPGTASPCHAGPRSALRPPTWPQLKIPPGSTGGAGTVRRVPGTHGPLPRDARLSRPSRGPATWACTCALARCPSARWPGAPMRSRRQGRPRRGRVAERADLARFLLPDPGQLPACGGCTRRRSFKPEYDKIRWEHGKHADALFPPGARAAPATRWWTPPWRRSTRRATCTTACAWWWPASCARTWASTGAGASLLCAAAQRLRPVGQQRRLAVGQLQRLRRAALFPHLQPGEPEREVRRAGQVHPPLPAAAGRLPDAAMHAPWKASPMERLAAGVTLGKDYPARRS